MLRAGAKGILTALGKVGGENILLTLGELLVLMDQVFYKMVERLEESRKWLRDSNTKVYLVFTLRDDSISVAVELKQILEKQNIKNFIFLLNKSISDDYLLSYDVQSFIKTYQKDYTGPYNWDYLELMSKYLQSFPILKNKILKQFNEFYKGRNQVLEIPILASIEDINELKYADLIKLGSFIENSIYY
jgi:hypothetical protein